MLALNLLLVTVHTLLGWPIYAEWPVVKASQILDNPFGAAAAHIQKTRRNGQTKYLKGKKRVCVGRKPQKFGDYSLTAG